MDVEYIEHNEKVKVYIASLCTRNAVGPYMTLRLFFSLSVENGTQDKCFHVIIL